MRNQIRKSLFKSFFLALTDSRLPIICSQFLFSSILVPKGTNIELSITANNRDPRYFGPSPETFNPDRFNDLPIEHSNSKFPPFKSFAFNAGPKSCIGSKFAMVEMKVSWLSFFFAFFPLYHVLSIFLQLPCFWLPTQVMLLDLISKFRFEPCPEVEIRECSRLLSSKKSTPIISDVLSFCLPFSIGLQAR